MPLAAVTSGQDYLLATYCPALQEAPPVGGASLLFTKYQKNFCCLVVI
jgi:hypothetical protein